MTTISKPSNVEYKEKFDKIAQDYDGFSNDYAVNRRRQALMAWAKGDCLEVGAGTGVISRELVKNHKVIATDISPKMVEQIKKNLNIDARVCDAEELPFEPQSFDTVIASECIYYLDNPQKFIQEAYRVLKPKGRLIISSANTINKFYEELRSLLRRLGFSRMYFDDPNRNFYSAKRLKDMLNDGDFAVLDIEKAIVLPFPFLDSLNRILEKTFLNRFAVFIFVKAEKT